MPHPTGGPGRPGSGTPQGGGSTRPGAPPAGPGHPGQRSQSGHARRPAPGTALLERRHRHGVHLAGGARGRSSTGPPAQRLGVVGSQHAGHERSRERRKPRRRRAVSSSSTGPGSPCSRPPSGPRHPDAVLGLHPGPRRAGAAGPHQSRRVNQQRERSSTAVRARPAGAGRCRGRRPQRHGGPGAAPPRCPRAPARPAAPARRRPDADRRPPPPPPRAAPPAPRAAGSRRPGASSCATGHRPHEHDRPGVATRGQRSTSSSRGRTRPQRVQRASSPQWRHASRRAPPVRL